MKALRSADAVTRGARIACAPRRPTAATALLAGLLTLAACEAAQEAAMPPAARIANPASVYCAGRGGRLEILDEPDGQTGFCTLPDGRRIEEWALYRKAHGNDPQAPQADTATQ